MKKQQNPAEQKNSISFFIAAFIVASITTFLAITNVLGF